MEGRTNKCDTALKTHDAQQAENQHGGVAGRGGFEVFKPKKLPECFDGLQAHLSNFASGRNGGARKPMLTSSSLISKYCNPDSLSRVKCISDADTWRYVDVELEKINKEDDVLSDKSSSFSPERETQRKRSYSTFKGSFSNVSLPLLRNSGRSSSFACVDGMMQKIAKHGQEDISFFGEENSGPPSVDGIRILYFPTLLNQSYVLKILNYYQVARKAHWKTPFLRHPWSLMGKMTKFLKMGRNCLRPFPSLLVSSFGGKD
ncbi:hypothetical protein HPP92_028474, partial [Vanilla planifolia]